MNGRSFFRASLYAACLCASSTFAVQDEALKDYLYEQSFEANDPFIAWDGNGKGFKVNYRGLVEETPLSGKRCLKLDMSFTEEGRFIWSLPLGVPSENLEELSGYMRLGAESTGQAAIGASFRFPPTKAAMCTLPVGKYKTTGNQWRRIEIKRLGQEGLHMCRRILERDEYAAKPENVLQEMEGIIIDFDVKAGDRVVVYLDDFKVTGRIPEKPLSEHEMMKRWAPVRDKVEAKQREWFEEIERREKRYDEINGLNNPGQTLKASAKRGNKDLRKCLAENLAKGYYIGLSKNFCREVDDSLRQQDYVASNLNKLKGPQPSDFLCYVIPSPFDGRKVLPLDELIPGELGNEMSLKTCRGEYGAVSFAIRALNGIDALKLDIPALAMEDSQDIIGIGNIDAKTVKCWYQAGTAWLDIGQDKSKRAIVPELLLNDDSLVKVDYEKRENYLKLQFPDGGRYECVSIPMEETKIHYADEFPVMDMKSIQPVSIPAGNNKQFLLTIKTPENAKPGVYTGRINLLANGRKLGDLGLKVEVLPFKLSQPYYTSSIDYHARIAEKGSVTTSSPKTKTQFKADLENMLAHGITNCQHYFPVNEKSLREVLELRREVGMDNKTLYLKGVNIGNPSDKASLEKVKSSVRQVIAIAKEYGCQEVYFYGMDEEKGEVLASQRAAWNAVHEAGGKIFVAGFEDNIKLMGDIQDMCVRWAEPNREEVARWHAYGHKIFCYGNPQLGVENPDVYRRNFGLLLWKYDYDGAADNAYQHSFGNIWNDFSNRTYRSHSIVYPTVDGGINTIAWEGYREGVNDVRYITTLERELEKVKKAPGHDDRSKQNIKNAELFIASLKEENDIETKDLNGIRDEITKHILKLTQH